MATKTVHVSDVPNLLQLMPENAGISLLNGYGYERLAELASSVSKSGKNLVVIGHRGCGMNLLQSPNQRMKAIKENTILSFNAAGKFPLNFIEFDVQVTKDDCPVIFHDNFILVEEQGAIIEKRVTDLTSTEFLSYGPQKDTDVEAKPLWRKTKDGKLFEWKVENDHPFCTLEDVFEKVDHALGFNIELKFDDNLVYKEDDLVHTIQVVFKVVFKYAKDRPIIFSSFQPDAAQMIRKLQNTYPVYFLTNGGSEIYADIRRNSLDEAIKLCLTSGLQGIVSEVKGILRNPGAITKIKESNLSLITYGQSNNVAEVVYVQHLMGVEGVIVDLVEDITQALCSLIKPVKTNEEDKEKVAEKENLSEPQLQGKATTPHLSQLELSYLSELVSTLVQNSSK